MGTDGLWDVTSNEMVASLCAKTFQYFPINEQEDENAQCSSSSSSSGAGDTARSKDRSGKLNFKYRYISAAQDLVMYARGKMKDNNARVWKTVDGTAATMDDISVFVIPLKGYQTANLKWKTKLTLNSQ